MPHVCPDVGVSHFDAATAETGLDCLALIAARLFDAATTAGDCLALVAAKPATATTATTTSALRRVDFFGTSGLRERARVRARSIDDFGTRVARSLVFRDGLEDCHA